MPISKRHVTAILIVAVFVGVLLFIKYDHLLILKYVNPAPETNEPYNNSVTFVKEMPALAPRTWLQAASLLEWNFGGPPDYLCARIINLGNWPACLDKRYMVKEPCLVYSFGINWDYSFDDATEQLGCEVHSFDPSMKGIIDHKRNNNTWFHKLGLSHENSGEFKPMKSSYTRFGDNWNVMTLKSIRTTLGHENRVIDILKLDIESYEWKVLDNLLEDKQLSSVRQFLLEWHLFPKFPPKEDYIKLLQNYNKFKDLGFKKIYGNMHPHNYNPVTFNIQADLGYVNSLFNETLL